MTTTLPSTASLTVELEAPGETCVVCDTSKQLVCPECPDGTQCQFIYPVGCHECNRATCVPAIATPLPSTSQEDSSDNVGTIVGGVLGGIAAMAIITYLVWRFCVRTRRQPIIQEPWDESQDQGLGSEKTFAQQRDYRASTHTVHSIASTVLTRASNIIQIAYIPGVTNRATASPTVLVPPVPPIPIAISQAGTPTTTDDQHFFVPGDLRDSTYSGLSSFSDRTSYARTSYAPRSSVASTIYGKSAVVVAPAQTGMRAKPAMVSVRSAHSNNSTGSSTPPVPTVDYEKYNALRPPSPTGSTFSVGSTFLNNASTHMATPARAMVVRVGSVKKVGAKTPRSENDSITSPTVSGSTIRDSAAATIIVDSPAVDQGPFSDPPKSAAQSTTSLSAVIEEATRRASQRDSSLPAKGRERSPFGDEHATS
ncbi:Protein OPY2 [Madurella mycetomatis]|uniref:Protein OPY2 n=1 Tax=Madurella mycetomatis TaxID=100816 RepID=A0A175WE69_9PEZI|nr:Protein OPY2 [Madurella mycetomatis]